MTKKILHMALAVSLIICSISLLIFSAKHNPTQAQTAAPQQSDVVVAGTVMMGSGFSADFYVIGYNNKTGETSVLGKISPKDMRK